MAQPPKVGDKAPDFELPDQDKNKVKLSDYVGKKNVVLAFYPFDFSPICSNENACFTKEAQDFSSANAEVLGISIDSTWSHKAFAEKMGYKHHLLSDVKKEVIAKYGLLREELGCAERATVIIDKNGKVAYVKVQDIGTARNDQEILKVLKNLN